MRKMLLALGLIVVVPAVAIQAIPYGHNHSNPPARTQPAWPNDQVRTLAVNACYDCHSNETVWPWYSNVAPVSWLVQRDVESARKRLNFSALDQRRSAGGEREGDDDERQEMPPWYYTIMHPKARITADQRNEIYQALRGAGRGSAQSSEEGASTDDD